MRPLLPLLLALLLAAGPCAAQVAAAFNIGFSSDPVYNSVTTRSDLTYYGAVGNGVACDDSAFLAAAAYSASSGECIDVPAPSVAYLLCVGNIVLNPGCFRGVQSYASWNSPYGVGSTGSAIWVTGTTYSAFYLGEGTTLDSLLFYYPNQNGSGINVSTYPTITGSPIVYPATIAQLTVGGKVSLANLITDCQFINAYVAIDIRNAATIRDCHGYAVQSWVTITNNTAEVNIHGLLVSRGWYQSSAVTEGLGQWTQRYGQAFVFTGATGITVSGGTVYGYRTFAVLDGTVHDNNIVFSDILSDSTPQLAFARGAISNVQFTSIRSFALDAFSNTADVPWIDLTNCTASSGSELKLTAVSATQISSDGIVLGATPPKALLISGCKINFWGSASGLTRTVYALLIPSSSAVVIVTGSSFGGLNQSISGAISVAAATLIMTGVAIDNTAVGLTTASAASVMLSGVVFTRSLTASISNPALAAKVLIAADVSLDNVPDPTTLSSGFSSYGLQTSYADPGAPNVQWQQQSYDTNPAVIQLVKSRGGATIGSSDNIGRIEFNAMDSSNSSSLFAYIQCTASNATHGAVTGSCSMVATIAGTQTTVASWTSSGTNPRFNVPAQLLASEITGRGTASFAVGGATVIGSGATAVCATSHTCDSVSGTVTLTAGSGITTTGTILTITTGVTRTQKPSCVYAVEVSGGAPGGGINPTTSSTTTTLVITSNIAAGNGSVYTIVWWCGGV